MRPARPGVPFRDDRKGKSSGSERLQLIFAGAVILLGLLVRSERALTQPLWVDEAESTINALTILDHGVPTDSYLGNPIFENTLIKPWPGHPEYEFKDISYSDKGVAIYHGWLPLFSIAASLASFGIGPDHAHGEIRFGRGVDEMRYRTFVPRVPSIVFSAFMLLFVYWAGREMFGNTAACAALLAAALADNFVWLGCQARYYSATLAVVAACVYLIHRIMRRGAWRDFIALGIALSVLFHTHLLSFAIASTATAAMIPFWIGKRRIVFKASLTGAIVAIAALPWLLATGYLRHLGEIPGADECVSMRRSAGKPNRLMQTIENLEPGRAYSLSFYTYDAAGDSREPHTVVVAVEPAEVVHALSSRAASHKLSRHWLVFRARAGAAALTLSDWQTTEAPGGPAGQELLYDFVKVQPYLEAAGPGP